MIYEPGSCEWMGKILLEWPHSYETELSVESPPDEFSPTDAARQSFARVQQSHRELLHIVAERMLNLYNNDWRPANAPLLKQETLVQALRLESVSISENGWTHFYASAGELFAGNYIEFTMDSDGIIENAWIAG